uniref:Uncharacterized protein n=1 Tax=Vitrella brassicaformis TaxID=1169539 RepID=A0A7S1PBQ0_9ALVE|mmetsp:Transcript_49626/g.124453  ORF Transcript_49626/g.124453 Transcript_49626/m.124453 type:complete len:133 (+) Transcript_49626:47-445(+)
MCLSREAFRNTCIASHRIHPPAPCYAVHLRVNRTEGDGRRAGQADAPTHPLTLVILLTSLSERLNPMHWTDTCMPQPSLSIRETRLHFIHSHPTDKQHQHKTKSLTDNTTWNGCVCASIHPPPGESTIINPD